ncbi:MAG TPA: hypothetical protein VGD77_03160, partial [Gemmatimonadaceae bacterium]
NQANGVYQGIITSANGFQVTSDLSLVTTIDDAGQVSGRCGSMACVGYRASQIALGTLGGSYTVTIGMNNAGVLVGLGYDTSERQRAVMWKLNP